MTEAGANLLILGLGNVLLADDGLGVAAVARLERQYRMPPGVRAVDGGTLGLALLPLLEGCRDLILVDAVRAEAPPGAPVRLEGDEVPPAVRDRLSPHQIGVADLLFGAEWLGRSPRRIVLLGLVPESLDLALGRTPAVEARLPELVESVVAVAGEWGYELTKRPARRPGAATAREGRRGESVGWSDGDLARALGL